ncbi:hypothetical protein FOZ62_002763 [Perkinsus olseni]|uniref:Uncharacterized protein n=1 Tax=Perkinsus olseni TaxID=32597 RepID=A0A7J6TT69_PEROL|nr:hypothetical protein FOZ62_002763 [Perkinsus olseni]
MSGLGFMAMHPEMASAAYGLKERTHRGEVPDENLRLRLKIKDEDSGFSEEYRVQDAGELGPAFRLFTSAYDKTQERGHKDGSIGCRFGSEEIVGRQRHFQEMANGSCRQMRVSFFEFSAPLPRKRRIFRLRGTSCLRWARWEIRLHLRRQVCI